MLGVCRRYDQLLEKLSRLNSKFERPISDLHQHPCNDDVWCLSKLDPEPLTLKLAIGTLLCTYLPRYVVHIGRMN